jgi:uncharacterized protein (TIGR02569 family)
MGWSERRRPPAEVLAAFGADGQPTPITGGRGTAWRAGAIVLKPMDIYPEQLAWQAGLLDMLSEGAEGFRLARSVRRVDGGGLLADGWYAQEWLAGEHERRWDAVISAGERLTEAMIRVPRPVFLDARDDPWAEADRIAWGGAPGGAAPDPPYVERLTGLRRRVDLPSQLIHGDLGTNVLFAPGEPPGIIDFTPYWRPAGYQSAIVVVDALAWEGADGSILELVAHVEELLQLLVRALIFRTVADHALAAAADRSRVEEAYAPVVELVARLVEENPT